MTSETSAPSQPPIDQLSSIMAYGAPWWRQQPLSPAERELMAITLAAETRIAERDDVSTRTVRAAAVGANYHFTNCLIAAVAASGGFVAPVSLAMGFLAASDPIPHVRAYIEQGIKIPGWGTSFPELKGAADPALLPAHDALAENFSWMADRIDSITHQIQAHGKLIFPNHTTYLAACALIVGLPSDAASFLFVAGRLAAWGKMSLHPNHFAQQ